MNSYKFAASIYKVSGRDQYVDAAIRTPRGCVSYDEETGYTIMHMALIRGDIETIQIMSECIGDVIVICSRDNIRAISLLLDLINYLPGFAQNVDANAAAVVADLILSIIVYNVFASGKSAPWLLATLIRCSANYNVNSDECVSPTRASGEITRIIIDYSKCYQPPTYHDITSAERTMTALTGIYAAFSNGDSNRAADVIRNTRHRIISNMITPDLLDHNIISALSSLRMNASSHDYRLDSSAVRKSALSVLDEGDTVLVEPYGNDKRMRAWNYTQGYRWGKLADLLEGNSYIPRYHGKSHLIVIVCTTYYGSESWRILRAILRRWPVLNSAELESWICSRSESECNLLLEYMRAPISPDDFANIEHKLCLRICREHWAVTRVQYARLSVLIRLSYDRISGTPSWS